MKSNSALPAPMKICYFFPAYCHSNGDMVMARISGKAYSALALSATLAACSNIASKPESGNAPQQVQSVSCPAKAPAGTVYNPPFNPETAAQNHDYIEAGGYTDPEKTSGFDLRCRINRNGTVAQGSEQHVVMMFVDSKTGAATRYQVIGGTPFVEISSTSPDGKGVGSWAQTEGAAAFCSSDENGTFGSCAGYPPAMPPDILNKSAGYVVENCNQLIAALRSQIDWTQVDGTTAPARAQADANLATLRGAKGAANTCK
jgi:hypothetical protein